MRAQEEEACPSLSLHRLPPAHVSNAFLEHVKRKFQEVIALMSKLLPAYEASVHICSYLNTQNQQMAELEATSAVVGCFRNKFSTSEWEDATKGQKVFLSSGASYGLCVLNQHTASAIGSMPIQQQWWV